MHPIGSCVKESPVSVQEKMPATTGEARNGKRADAGGLALAVASVGGALFATSCCVVPFAMFTLGISGAWIGKLTALGPFQPVAVAGTLGALAAGFVTIYRRPKVACDTGYCARPAARRMSKIGLWFATSLIAVALAWPILARLFIMI
jgi:mercuric ion transport protein